MIVVIDNYDSFTYNLVQYLGELGKKLKVFRNDEVRVEEIRKVCPEAIIISAKTGLRIWEFAERMEQLLYVGSERIELLLSPARLNLLENLDDNISVQRKVWEDGSIRVVITGPEKLVRSTVIKKGFQKGEFIS